MADEPNEAVALVQQLLSKTVKLYKLLKTRNGSKGRVNKRLVNHTEAEIDLTLDQLTVAFAAIGINVANLIPRPKALDLDLYGSPDYKNRKKAIVEQRNYWKSILDDDSQPWKQ